MRETDISQYTEKIDQTSLNPPPKKRPVRNFLYSLWKLLLTVMLIGFTAFLIVGISVVVYIFGIASEPTGINLAARAMNQTSFIYVMNAETGEFEEYDTLYSSENRIWVDFHDIPEAMKEAMISIEDKRFYEHDGVDWTRTAGAVFSLATGSDNYGGSTITQQLIKNLTNDNDVSITRKIREIVRALKLEQEYTKDQILEGYLNVVNFGNNCQGCEAASELYFNKPISECSIAECAAIAGITQNPSKWNPLVYPENNKIRRETIINEMYDQGKITKEEFDQAMLESANMTFVGFQDKDDEEEDSYIQNWYIDQLVGDLMYDLASYYNIDKEAASDMLYTEGLKIYCAMDTEMQKYIEEVALNIDKSDNSELQTGMCLMGLDGRIIATVGGSEKKTGNLYFSRATDSSLQPGSSIKPVVVYPYAIETKKLYFSSFVKDAPIEKYKVVDGELVSGPNNWYSGYKGDMLLPDAIEISSNGTAAQVLDMIGAENAYNQAVTYQGFSHLSEDDKYNIGGLSIGGLNGGVTVTEMAAAYNYMGNGGLYYKPYTYYYVTDCDDNTILSPKEEIPKQAYSPETAYIMNRLLYYNVSNSVNTRAGTTRISGWEIIGKTGTTDEDKDSWFCGLSPYASLAIWTGFDKPERIRGTGLSVATDSFKKIMSKYLEDKEKKTFDRPESIIESYYSPGSGLLVESGNSKYIGYYTEDNMPSYGYYSDPNSSSNSSDDNEDTSNSASSSTDNENNHDGENPTEATVESGGNEEGGGDDQGGDGGEEAPSEAPATEAPSNAQE